MSKMFGNLFGSKPTVTTGPTQFEQLPEFARNAFESAVTEGTNLAKDTSLFAPAPFTPEYQSALSALQAGLPQVGGQEIEQSMGYFQNPYEEQVVQNSIADIIRGGQSAYSDILSGASRMGAFGGQREALLGSELQRNLLDQIARTSAQTRASGFADASNRALQLIGANRDLQQQSLSNLLQAGGAYQQQAQGMQSAPLEAINYRLGLAQGVPSQGGASNVIQDQGLFGRVAGPLGGLLFGIGGMRNG